MYAKYAEDLRRGTKPDLSQLLTNFARRFGMDSFETDLTRDWRSDFYAKIKSWRKTSAFEIPGITNVDPLDMVHRSHLQIFPQKLKTHPRYERVCRLHL